MRARAEEKVGSLMVILRAEFSVGRGSLKDSMQMQNVQNTCSCSKAFMSEEMGTESRIIWTSN